MKIFIFILFCVVFPVTLVAQHEAAFWYFGDHAGLDFNSGAPVALHDSRMHAEAGCAVISNKNGRLLFYTNGVKIWNRKHQIMQGGSGLNGSKILNQNSLIIPFPGSNYLFYLFTVNASYDTVGFNYSIIDMRLDDGLGGVTLKNQLLFEGFVEKLTGAKHCNGKDIWIVTHDREDGYYSFLLNADSLNKTPVVSHTGNNVRADIGYLKISPASNRIAMPLNNNNLLVEVCRFHNRSGKVFNPVKIMARDSVVYAYGIEFSPDGNLLYISTGGKQYKLWQYDITLKTETAINQSAQLIASGNNFALQLAPDGKIYVAEANRHYLSVINSPDKKAPDCDYVQNQTDLENGMSIMGLPNFLPFYFFKPQISAGGYCLGDTTYLGFSQSSNSDSLIWEFGDGSPPLTTSGDGLVSHLYHNTLAYPVKLLVYHCGLADTVLKTVKINNPPVVFLGNDTTLCNSCTITLNGGDRMDSLLWQDGSRSQYYPVQNAGLYSVTGWKNGCEATDSIYISKSDLNVYLPNAFTPDGDGLNDVFQPVTAEPLENYHLIIFNRYGKVIFESYDFSKGWDGNFKGKPVEIGVYTWKITYSYYNEQEQATAEKLGTVMLLR